MYDLLLLEWWYYGPCFVTYEQVLPCQSRHSTEGVGYEGWEGGCLRGGKGFWELFTVSLPHCNKLYPCFASKRPRVVTHDYRCRRHRVLCFGRFDHHLTSVGERLHSSRTLLPYIKACHMSTMALDEERFWYLGCKLP